MTTIDVQIAAVDDFVETAKRGSAVLERIAEQEKLIARYAKELGVNESVAAKAIAQVDREQRQAAATAERTARQQDAQRKRAEGEIRKDLALRQRLEAKRESSNKQQIESLKKAFEIGTKIAATIVAVGAAAVAAAVGLATLANEAARGARESRALMHGLTGGRGARALELVDQLAGRLGVRFQEAREQFTRFREAGASNSLSANLIKMRADLVAFGLSAEAADSEIDRVLRARGESGRAAALAEVSRAYNGIGDGALAARHATESVDGAMARLSNATTQALEALWERIGPNISSAANALADFVEGFVKSDEGRAALDRIAQGFQIVAGAAETTFNLLNNHWDRFVGVTSNASEHVGQFALGPLGGLVDVTRNIARRTRDAARDAGRNTSRGFAEGIRAGQPEAQGAATTMADRVAQSFRNFLGIESPSRLFAEYGANTVEGFERGQEAALPSAMPIERAAAVAPATAGAAPVSAGSVTIQQLIVYTNTDDPEEISRAIRAEMQRLLTAMAQSRGLS
jgi:hypothetical protein